jgi:hypothetical protein
MLTLRIVRIFYRTEQPWAGDLVAAAQKYLVPEKRTVITLKGGAE